jgi:lipopolysaccharide export system permease protein
VGAGKLGMGSALLLFHGGAFVLALTLLWWREQGNRAARRWLRRSVRPAAA